jgi:hypothetical protein
MMTTMMIMMKNMNEKSQLTSHCVRALVRWGLGRTGECD